VSLIENAVARLEAARPPGETVHAAPGEWPRSVFPLKPSAAENDPSASTGGRVDAPPSAEELISFGMPVELPQARMKEKGFLTAASRATATGHEFRMIKAPILEKAFGNDGRRIANGRRVVVTSAIAGEGKTFCAINLAISIAAAGSHSVLLVDADVAKSSVAALLGLGEGKGVIDLLTGRETDVLKVIQQTDLPGLAVLPAGQPESHAGEHLASREMASLLDRVSAAFPQLLIVIDTPPLLAVTETRSIVQQAGQTILVVSAGATTRALVDAALATIAGASDISMILNKLPASRSEFSAYYDY
jgi:exopolysaccharide/PEP-CTERM locus tyrosine autokinase